MIISLSLGGWKAELTYAPQ